MRHCLPTLTALLLTAAAAHADGYRVWYAHPGSDWSAGTFTYPSESAAAFSADAFRRDGYAAVVLPDGYRPASPPRPAPQSSARPHQHCPCTGPANCSCTYCLCDACRVRPPQAPPAWTRPPQAPPIRINRAADISPALLTPVRPPAVIYQQPVRYYYAPPPAYYSPFPGTQYGYGGFGAAACVGSR